MNPEVRWLHTFTLHEDAKVEKTMHHLLSANTHQIKA